MDLIQLDTQDNVYFIASQVSGSETAKVVEGSLSTALSNPTGTPTFATLFTNNVGTQSITGLEVDPDNSVVYFDDGQSFYKNSYAGNTGTVTTLGTASVFLDGLALDLPAHVAYFANATTGNATTTTLNGQPELGPNHTGDSHASTDGAHIHYHTTVTSNAIYETSNLTNASGSNSITFSKLVDIPVADGAVFEGQGEPGIAVDTTTGIIYFTTKTVSGHEGGVFSYNPSTSTLTQIWRQNGSAGTLNSGTINAITIDHATGEYFISVIGLSGEGGAVYVGHLNSTNAPTLWETIPTFSGGTDNPAPDGMSIDNAPTLASVTGDSNYALQGGSSLNIVVSDGTDAEPTTTRATAQPSPSPTPRLATISTSTPAPAISSPARSTAAKSLWRGILRRTR